MENLEYTIIKSDRKTLSLQIKNGALVVRAPKRIKDKDIAAVVESRRAWIEKHLSLCPKLPPFTEEEKAALIEQAKVYIPSRVQYYAGLMGCAYGKLSFKIMSSRWGSCSSKGNLSFNALLMLAPPQVLDSVVVHELCHLKQMNHSKQFYVEVLKYYPQYNIWHPWLKKNGGGLTARI
ncbi:MAG: M48 family metallopeptidase [Clostridia bacterium]|nr:M48 family metallopeptidase [Clostridia bacterium]